MPIGIRSAGRLDKLDRAAPNFDRFFRIALCQQHVAFQSAAIDVIGIPAKHIFKKREGLVVFLILKGNSDSKVHPADNRVPAWSSQWKFFLFLRYRRLRM